MSSGMCFIKRKKKTQYYWKLDFTIQMYDNKKAFSYIKAHMRQE